MASQLFNKSVGNAGADAPEVIIPKSDISEEITLIDLLFLGKLFPTKSDARHLIKDGGLYIEGEKVTDVKALADISQFSAPSGVPGSKRQKKYFNVKVQ